MRHIKDSMDKKREYKNGSKKYRCSSKYRNRHGKYCRQTQSHCHATSSTVPNTVARGPHQNNYTSIITI